MKYILTIILLFSYNAYANDSEDNSVLKIIDKYKLQDFNINYSINKSNNIQTKFKESCEINYNEDKKFVNFEFSLLHEFGHCVLGKSFFYKDINWKINLSEKEKEKISKYIKENEFNYLKNKNTKLLKVIYHEIYADVFASLMYIKYNKNTNNKINKIINYRIINENLNKNEIHLSYDALINIKKLNKKAIKNLTIEKIQLKSVIITQESFFKYINNEYN